MTLEQLRVFVAVAERQHVTRAAEALNIAQSAVSASVAALEGRHGAKLFHRVGRGIELTEAGALFLAEARAVLARAGSAELVLSELGGLKRGALSVYASQTIAGYWLPSYLVTFRRLYPGVSIGLSIGNTSQAAAAVRGGGADLSFVEGEVEDPVLISQQVARDQLMVVVASEHPWGGRERLTKSDLLDIDWVLREPGSGTRSVFYRAVEEFGLSPSQLRVALELPSNEAVRAAVEAGMGATAISASVAASSIEAGLLRQVDFPLRERRYYVLRHAERYRSRAAESLIDIIQGRDSRSRGLTDGSRISLGVE
jgi:DNA-binding transcriptional LysR family regulator